MKVKAIFGQLGVFVIALSMPAVGQEGHPLTGTWYGEWGPEAQGNQVMLSLTWDGRDVTGIMLNPGPESVPLTVVLDSSEWRVHIEVAGDDSTVGPVLDGVLEDVGSRNRTLSGTWSQNGADYEFRVTRED